MVWSLKMLIFLMMIFSSHNKTTFERGVFWMKTKSSRIGWYDDITHKEKRSYIFCTSFMLSWNVLRVKRLGFLVTLKIVIGFLKGCPQFLVQVHFALILCEYLLWAKWVTIEYYWLIYLSRVYSSVFTELLVMLQFKKLSDLK